MTKQEARKIIVMEARIHKRLQYEPDIFELKLKNRNDNLDEDVHEAYDLIKDEMVHILSVVWNFNR